MTCCCSPVAPPPEVLPQLRAPLGGGPQWPSFTPLPIGLPNVGQETAPQEFLSGAIGAAASVTFTTPSFQAKGGRVLIWGHISATGSAAANELGTLRLDVAGVDTVLDTAASHASAAASDFQLSFFATVVLTPGAHTLSVRAVASAGTNTVAAGNAKIMIQEL